MGRRRPPYRWHTIPGVGPTVISGYVAGLPALWWGWADRGVLATRRQLHAKGLRRGGQQPVALVFEHARPNRRRVEHAHLYLIATAVPTWTATPTQRAAINRALRARRTCRRCGAEQPDYLSTISRMCGPCVDATDFWRERAAEQGWCWAA